MNKHLIILPLLITSAVSLHILSFQLEEPDEIVLNPEESVSSPPTDASFQPTPEESTSESSVASSIEPSSEPNNSSSPMASSSVSSTPSVASSNVKPSSKPQVKPTPKVNPTVNPSPAQTPVAVVTPMPSPTPILSPDTLKIASVKYIPIKGFNDIVKEAKVSSGRMDPFLSMDPPEINPIPIVSAPPKSEVFNQTSKEKKVFGTPFKLKEPPKNWVPSFDSPGKTKNKFSISPVFPKKNPITGKPLTKQEVKQIEQERIEFEVKSMTNGIQLTGIITGSKPVAIVKVGDESKVVAIGQVIKTDSEGRDIKITSIDINNQVISLSNGRRKAKIEVKEE